VGREKTAKFFKKRRVFKGKKHAARGDRQKLA